MKNIDSNTGKTTSVCIYLNGESIYKWDNIKRKSNFASQLINSYFNNELVSINLKDDIKKKFDEEIYKDALINRLLEQHYKGNIMFIDEFLKAQEIGDKIKNNISTDKSEQTINTSNFNSSNSQLKPIEEILVNNEVNEKEEENINNIPSEEVLVQVNEDINNIDNELEMQDETEIALDKNEEIKTEEIASSIPTIEERSEDENIPLARQFNSRNRKNEKSRRAAFKMNL